MMRRRTLLLFALLLLVVVVTGGSFCFASGAVVVDLSATFPVAANPTPTPVRQLSDTVANDVLGYAVVKGGELVASAGPSWEEDVWSVTKTWVATLIGVMMQNGTVSAEYDFRDCAPERRLERGCIRRREENDYARADALHVIGLAGTVPFVRCTRHRRGGVELADVRGWRSWFVQLPLFGVDPFIRHLPTDGENAARVRAGGAFSHVGYQR